MQFLEIITFSFLKPHLYISQDSEENEIIEDKVTRDLAREYCLSVKILLDEPKHLKGIHQTPLHSYLFTSDLFSKTVAYTILGCIQWPDSQANRKALGLGVSFIQTVVKQGKDSLYNVAGELLFLAIRGLLFPHLKELQNEVLTLIREGYILLVSVSQIPQTIFASIGMKPNEIETFHKQFMSSEDEKKQKITLKSFLLKFFEARDQSKLTKPSILDLQERVFKPEKPEKPSWGDFEENGIQNLFNNN